jgi:hypothetical protein
VTWFRKWDKVMDYSYQADDLHIRWFEGGKLNIAYNCLDRHLETRGDQVAIIWEGDNPRKTARSPTASCTPRSAAGQRAEGPRRAKGDRVCIYLPMIPEAAVAMLACARIGAVHSIVFGGFSPDSLRDRILDSDCRTLITSDESVRGGRQVPLKKNADKPRSPTAPTSAPCSWCAAPAATSPGATGATSGTTRPSPPSPPSARRRDGRRGPAVHPLHLRLHREAQGRAAHHRRLPGLRRHDPQVHLRLPGRRGLLVHRRRGLGHRPHLHRLRPAGQRRHLADVRGHPQLPGRPASGRWSTSTRSTSSTPPPPPSAP